MAHYVDNKSLYATMVEFKVACKDAEECGEEAESQPRETDCDREPSLYR